MAQVIMTHIITEFHYPYSTLYLDYRGRVAHSLIKYFPLINERKLVEEDDIVLNDNDIVCKIGINRSGAMLKEIDSTKIGIYLEKLSIIFDRVTQLFDLAEKIVKVPVSINFKVTFKSNKEMEDFKQLLVPNRMLVEPFNTKLSDVGIKLQINSVDGDKILEVENFMDLSCDIQFLRSFPECKDIKDLVQLAISEGNQIVEDII